MSGYDPDVSGPWSDVDSHPKVWHVDKVIRRVVDRMEAAREEQAYWDRIMAEWDEREGGSATSDPDAYKLARELRLMQPTWADGEECGIGTEMVREALDKLGWKRTP